MPRFHGRFVQILCALAVFGFVRTALAGRDRVRNAENLRRLYPGLRVHSESDRTIAIYGRAMNSAATAEGAVREWLDQHGTAFNVPSLDLRLTGRTRVGVSNRNVFAYQQYVDGLPVENGTVRVLVRDRIRGTVLYAAGHVIRRPEKGFPAINASAQDALNSVRRLSQYGHLSRWSKPELVVFAGENDPLASPIRAWKFTGEHSELPSYDAYTFFVDAASGEVVHARREVYFRDVEGHVRGMGSPGVRPDTPANPATAIGLANLDLSGPDATSRSGADGEFTLTNAGETSIQITGDLVGPWVRVLNQQGDDLHLDESVSPIDPANLLFNSVPTEFTTSQVNAFVHINLAHDFYKTYQPAFTDIDVQMPTRVNLDSTCNAFFSPIDLSFNFYNAGGCVNTAYSSVIAHEFGHFIVHRLRLRQQAFGEGFGDAVAILLFNDPIVGHDFLGLGNHVRDVVTADEQFPCRGEVHECGQVLGGSWWDIKQALASSLGEDQGLETARQLFTDWSQITLGIPFGLNSANPRMAVEALTVDDDDDDINNGTPHMAEICAGFANHSIPCPGVCEQVKRLRLTCRPGTLTLTADLTTDYPAGTEVGFTLDEGVTTRSDTVDSRGKASVSFSKLPPAFHKVCIDGCPGVCRTIGCAP